MFSTAQKGVDRKLPVFLMGVGDGAQRTGSQALGPVREQHALGAKQRVDPVVASRRLDCLVGAD
jgi:hypothetical protein